MWVSFQTVFSNGFSDKWLESKWICTEEVSKERFQKAPRRAHYESFWSAVADTNYKETLLLRVGMEIQC